MTLLSGTGDLPDRQLRGVAGIEFCEVRALGFLVSAGYWILRAGDWKSRGERGFFVSGVLLE